MPSPRNMFVFVTLAVAAVACAPAAPPPPPPPDVAAITASIEAANARFADAMTKGDTATAFGNYTDDAVVMLSNQPAWRGRAEWSAGFAGMLASMALKDMSFKVSEVVVEGDVAIETGTYSMTVTPKGGPDIKDDGKYMTVWRKQADGSWKIMRDISNTSMPAQ